MLEFLASAVSWLLAMSFAAIWGAHIFQATVLFPVWGSDPPKSLLEWLAAPYAMRVAVFFQRLAPTLYIVAVIALVVAIAQGTQMRLALAIAAVCGLIHLTMIVLIFVPMNLKLGLDPNLKRGGPGAASLDPQTMKTLVRRWGRWNLVRLVVETTGLIAALFAVKAS